MTGSKVDDVLTQLKSIPCADFKKDVLTDSLLRVVQEMDENLAVRVLLRFFENRPMDSSTTTIEDRLLGCAIQSSKWLVVTCLRRLGASFLSPQVFLKISSLEALRALEMHESWCGIVLLGEQNKREEMEGQEEEKFPLAYQLLRRSEFSLLGLLEQHFSSWLKSLPSSSIHSLPDELQKALRLSRSLSHAPETMDFSKNVIIDDLSGGRERYPLRVVNDVDGEKPTTFVYSTRLVDPFALLSAIPSTSHRACDCGETCSESCACSTGAYEPWPTIHQAVQHTQRFYSSSWWSGWRRAVVSRLSQTVRECNLSCGCSLSCGNRVAQKGCFFPLEAFRTCDGRGWAVRSLVDIPRGAFIAEYTGEVIPEDEAQLRKDDTFLFETSLGNDLLIIDAAVVGNSMRFVNHSCSPNAQVGLVSWESSEDPLYHLCVFASRSISRNEEITINYSKKWWMPKWFDGLTCLCGSPTCEFDEKARQRMNAISDHSFT